MGGGVSVAERQKYFENKTHTTGPTKTGAVRRVFVHNIAVACDLFTPARA
jgi:hypothetical protein